MNRLTTGCIFLLSVFLFSCDREDPGPLQEETREFTVIDFDRLEMGSAFKITVEEGSVFKISARGDRRNINDLKVYKTGSTLVIKYDESANRKHETYIRIKMPVLKGVNFSGATESVIEDFESDESLDVNLAGASVCQIDADYKNMNIVLSGASKLYLSGDGDAIEANISGASTLKGFNYDIREVLLNASGASNAEVSVSDKLSVTANGASEVFYKGN